MLELAQTEQVKIYGERNSGTTVLRRALQHHFQARFLYGTERIHESEMTARLNRERVIGLEREYFREALIDDAIAQVLPQELGWKHASPPLEAIQAYPDLHALLFVLITKDPYSWLLSLYRRPYHQLYSKKLAFSDFIRHYWLTVRRDNLPWSVLKNPIHLYNLKLQGYRELTGLPCRYLHLKYRDFLNDYAGTMERFSLYLRLRPQVRDKGWALPLQSAKNDALDFADYRQKYRPEQIRAQLSPQDLAFINEQLEPELMAFWGYDFLG